MSWNCKHCNKSFEFEKPQQKANHSRWCEHNPKSKEYRDNLSKSREAITKDSRKNANLKIKQNWKEGRYNNADFGKAFRGKKHTEESKSRIREAALRSDHRRLRKNPIEYKGVLLDSTWELELAKRLDYLEIKWERPNPLKYKDNEGIEHNYFPDFYLIDYDLYLDPKNPHACNVQSDKIKILKETYKNIIVIKTLEECINFSI
jgi:hypothetical protein